MKKQTLSEYREFTEILTVEETKETKTLSNCSEQIIKRGMNLAKIFMKEKKVLISSGKKMSAWYKEFGISEDKASELLRVYRLYQKVENNDSIDKIKAKIYLGKISTQIALLLARKENEGSVIFQIIKEEIFDCITILKLLGISKKNKNPIANFAKNLDKALKEGKIIEVKNSINSIEKEIKIIKEKCNLGGDVLD